MRCRYVPGLVAAVVVMGAPVAWAGDGGDGVFASLAKEMKRNIEGLHLRGAPRPYFFGVLYSRASGWTQTGTLGKEVSERHWSSASLSGVVRVGSYESDDTNFYGSSPAAGVGAVSLDADDLSLRRAAHSAWDAAYKRAIQVFSKKKAFLVDHPKAKRCADWSHPKVRGWTRKIAGKTLDPVAVHRAILAATAVFRRHPKVLGSAVSLGQSTRESFMLTSEGLRVQESSNAAGVAIVVAGRAPDGRSYSVRWFKTLFPRDVDPGGLGLVERATKLAGRLERILAAPVLDENYSGPVLFQGGAAASLWATFIAKGLRADMPAVSWAGGRMMFEGMKGRRILPESVTIVDDPTVERYRGKVLYGAYQTDDEGVAARKVLLVDRGKLSGFLASRRPSVETKTSNGHGRTLNGLSLSPMPNGSNVFIKVRRALSAKALKRKYLKMLRKEGLDHGYIIRSFGGAGLTARGFVAYGTSRSIALPSPLEIYKVDLKGHERLVREVRIEAIQMADFASIPAIGGPERVVTVQDPSGRGVSLIYRDFILSRMSLTRPPAGQFRLPLLPSPLARLLSGAK